MWRDEDYEPFLDEVFKELGVTEEELALAEGNGDAREYAMEHWGWKRVAGHQIETWTLTPNDIDAIVSGIGEILGESEEGDDEKLELYIYVYSNGKSYDFTLAQLEAMIRPKQPQVPQHPFQAPTSPQQPIQPPSLDPLQQQKQVSRDRFHADIDQVSNAADKHQIDQDLINMPDYYKNKKHPFADWTFRTHGKIL